MVELEQKDEWADDQDEIDAPRRDKALIQLNWVNITIKAMPAQGRCKGQGALLEERTIIDNVSGAVLPGQFLAIIGASGKIASM